MNEALNSDIEHNAKAQVVKEAKTEQQANYNINNGLTLEPSGNTGYARPTIAEEAPQTL